MPFGTGRLFLVWSLALAYHYQAAFTKPRNIGPFFFSIYGIGFECKAKDIDPKSLHKGPLIERTWNGVIWITIVCWRSWTGVIWITILLVLFDFIIPFSWCFRAAPVVNQRLQCTGDECNYIRTYLLQFWKHHHQQLVFLAKSRWIIYSQLWARLQTRPINWPQAKRPMPFGTGRLYFFLWTETGRLLQSRGQHLQSLEYMA